MVLSTVLILFYKKDLVEVFLSFFYFCTMASNLKNLGDHSEKNMVSMKNKKIGIVVSEWNDQVTDSLLSAAYEVLVGNGAKAQRRAASVNRWSEPENCR